ncbi:MAG: hypothetical protein LIR50_21970 [Bacillota bacterium]|nr:hypothetical protein [Bacillota bacterium]
MKFKKILLYAIPFLMVIIVLVYTPKSKDDESSAYNIKKDKYDMNNYLEKNHSEIDTKACTNFNLLDEDINKNNVIIAGEYKGVSKNYQIKLSLLKYLNEKHGVRYLLENIGYSEAYFLNQYLKSGDESILKALYFSTGKIEYAFGDNDFQFKESYDFWKELRKYNLSIPDDKRIIVIGIGTESKEYTTLRFINLLMPVSEPPAEIKPCIKAYKDKCRKKIELENKFEKIVTSPDEIDKTNEILHQLQDNNEEIYKSIEKLKKNMEINPEIYEKYLGSRYFDFEFVFNNTVNSYYDGIGINTFDSDMYGNFKKIYSNLPPGKYFGQFNKDQVYRNIPINMDNHTRFAEFLNGSDSPVKGRVLSIAYGYENSKAILYMGENAETAEPFDVDILKDISKSDTTLFKLNGDNSPFSKKTYFITANNDMNTTDYFKYIILIKKSEAVSSSWIIMNNEED